MPSANARLRAVNESRDEIEALLGNVLILRFLLALVTALVVIAAAWLTGRPTEMIVAIALGTIGLVMYSAEGTAQAFLSGYERLDLVSGAKVFYQLIFVLLGAVALLLGAGYFGLIGTIQSASPSSLSFAGNECEAWAFALPLFNGGDGFRCYVPAYHLASLDLR